MDEPTPTQPPQTVTRLGSYRLVEPLGSGGMSSVFLAVHDGTGYEVALKVLPRYLAKNPTLLQRFLREAQSAESLEHPNIVSIYDRGSEDGRHYLVLEYVDGSDLHDRVRRLGPLPVVEALRVVVEASRGLRYAASKGVIHRDIKPANILMAADGAVKLIDLGLALQSEAEDERVTRHGTTVGTVDYMSPEQARDSRSANERSDMYSLGCTLYYVLTGFPPFAGGHIADKLRRHATQPPPDVRQLRPEVPRAVAKLIQRLLAKRPDDRFADYDGLIAAVESLDLDGEDNSGSFEFALIADDDEQSADFDLGDGVSLFDSPTTRDLPPVPEGGRRPPSGSPTPVPAPAVARNPVGGAEPEVKLSELAALLADEDEPASRRKPAPPPPPAAGPPEPLRRGRRAVPAEPFDPFDDLDGEDAEVAPMALGRRRAYGEDASVKAWALGGALIGLVIALLGFAVITLIRMDWSGGPKVGRRPEGAAVSPVDPSSRLDALLAIGEDAGGSPPAFPSPRA